MYKVMGSDDAGSDTGVLSGAVSISNWMGIKDPTDDQLEPAFGANPGEILYLHVFTAEQDTTLEGPGVRFSIKADLTTKFREKKKLDESV